MLTICAIFALRYPAVQTYVSKKAANYLSRQLHTEIRIGKVHLKPFRSLLIEDISINDLRGKKMLDAKSITATFSLTKLFQKEIEIRKLTLEDAYTNYEYYGDSSNISFLIDYFTSPKDSTSFGQNGLQFRLKQVVLKNNQFKLVDHRYTSHPKGVNFADLDIYAISGEFVLTALSNKEVEATISKLTFQEKSGLHLRELSTEAYISSSKMEFKNLSMRLNRSKIGSYLLFHYHSFSDFENFIEKVQIKGELADAFVDSRDIEFFAPQMSQVKFISAVNRARVSGTVANLRAEGVSLTTGTNTHLEGSFSMYGLPDIQRTRFDFDLASLRTSSGDVEKLASELAGIPAFQLPDALHKLGTVGYRGRFRGFYHDFRIEGQATTTQGSLNTNSHIVLAPTLKYTGLIESKAFDIGQLLSSKEIGKPGFHIRFDGEGFDLARIKVAAQGQVNNFTFHDYVYRQVTFDGRIADRLLTTEGKIDDTHATLTFDGDMRWEDGLPTAYNLSSTIETLDLKRLNLFSKDSIVVEHANVRASLAGESLNLLNGHIHADDIQFRSSRGIFAMDRLEFTSAGNEESKLLTLESDIVDGQLNGQIDLHTIGAYFRSLAMRYAPAINIESSPYNPQNFDLRLAIKSFNPVSALFDPDLRLEHGASLTAKFSSDDYKATFKAFSPTVAYKGMKIENLSLTEQADNRAFSLLIDADRFSFSDSAYIDHIHIRNILANDSLTFQVALSEDNRENYLNLNGNIHFAHNKPAYVRFEKSDIVLNNEKWEINEDADLRVSKGKFYLKNLLLKRDRQEVRLNGILSNEDDDLEVAFRDFSLSSLAGITKSLGIQLQGSLNGDIRIHSIFQKPTLSTHISTTPIIFNNLPIGTLRINADFAPANGLIQLNGNLSDVDGRGVEVKGTYEIGSPAGELQLHSKIKDLDAGILQPFLQTLVSDLYGKISGDLHIIGTLRDPIINGTADIRDASFLVNYLQTTYVIANQQSVIQNNRVHLHNFQFSDVKNSKATAKGYVDLSRLSDPTLDIEATAENFQILNTGRKDNETFFGTAYASGTFSFKGPTSGINIDINARSNTNTTITIPFNSSLKVSDNDFFYFTNIDSAEKNRSISKRLFQGITMNMDLNLTRDAEINLENNLGSLKGVGTGNISLRISNLGDFEMFGDYNVLAGKFHFTAQDFFNKFFDLKEGGTIRWAGNPAEATVNLSASYQQRTSVAPLYNAAGRTENNDRILAQADMILKGTLSQPEVSFDLNFPQDPYVKDELQGYLSDGNNVNQQAISLIVRRSFTPASTQEFGREVNNTLLSAGTEIAFNQLNSIISQSLNMNFLDLNIRSFNDASASLRFFDDRLILTGGVSDRSRSQLNDLTLFSDQVATDAEVTFRLRQDGNLVLRAYNRLNTRNFLFTPYSDYISAVGVVYRQEFNTLSEFWRKLWIWNERKQKAAPLLILPNNSSSD
ncbi:translocation/assembly module TamB domain-containing protein [Sphingobacterium griseoflavum]|uniref:Translocation and assembly module TamB C-terminal domain-containing protein n=1 Tax=Sphingobacterium griseoflavum TaxID=1474952 RepID=A0ABQ3HPC0_9SPHI|nr:translocation/assembly module TamB domain-containing protein [Sphingobacterium griseoflavum]GHE23081.1 hypothetical protein GCM10017764_00490 [Sphingobacterium griseoflavum]